jgi:hypothetical protein
MNHIKLQEPPLAPKWASVLRVIAMEAPWRRTPEAIARQIGQDRESLTDILADMHVAGLLDVLEEPDGIVVSPSRAGYARLRGRAPRVPCRCGTCPTCRGCPTGPRLDRRSARVADREVPPAA